MSTNINVIDVDKIGSATSPLALAKTVALVSSSESTKAGDVRVMFEISVFSVQGMS